MFIFRDSKFQQSYGTNSKGGIGGFLRFAFLFFYNPSTNGSQLRFSNCKIESNFSSSVQCLVRFYSSVGQYEALFKTK